MDKHTQSRNKNFKNRASLNRGKTNLSYQERVAKREKTKGISLEHFANSGQYVVFN